MNESEWSDNQRRFVRDARAEGLVVEAYSGRNMYGAECPSVTVACVSDCTFTRARFSTDSMGLGIVCYAAT